MYQRENGKQTLICTQSLPKTFWVVLKSAFNLTEIWRWGPIDFSWNVEENGGYFHFSKSQICHPTYPMSSPITFRPWMDKLCENKFLGANSAFPYSFDFFKSLPIWGGTKRCKGVTDETAFWETVMDLFMRGSCFPGRSMAPPKKENTIIRRSKWSPSLQPAPPPILIDEVFFGNNELLVAIM